MCEAPEFHQGPRPLQALRHSNGFLTLAPPSHNSATIAESMALARHAPCRAHIKKAEESHPLFRYKTPDKKHRKKVCLLFFMTTLTK